MATSSRCTHKFHFVPALPSVALSENLKGEEGSPICCTTKKQQLSFHSIWRKYLPKTKLGQCLSDWPSISALASCKFGHIIYFCQQMEIPKLLKGNGSHSSERRSVTKLPSSHPGAILTQYLWNPVDKAGIVSLWGGGLFDLTDCENLEGFSTTIINKIFFSPSINWYMLTFSKIYSDSDGKDDHKKEDKDNIRNMSAIKTTPTKTT